jgi:hypothetical protein
MPGDKGQRAAEPLLGRGGGSGAGPCIEIVHWPMRERVLDPIFIGVLLYLVVKLCELGPNNLGGDNSTGWFTFFLGFVPLAGSIVYLVIRPSRHIILVFPDIVVYSGYCCFGYLRRRTATLARSELGCLVFDTQSGCYGLCGFMGVYLTRGLPMPGAPVAEAFQIRLLGVHRHYCSSRFAPDHFSTYCALHHALGFQLLSSDLFEHVTTHTQTDRSGQIVDQYSTLDDSLSYAKAASVNPRLLPAKWTINYTWGSPCGRPFELEVVTA